MSDLTKDLLDAARERWHTKTGLVAALTVVTASLVVAFAGIKLEDVSATEWAIVAAVFAAICLIWRRTRLPRIPRGKLGFGLALDCEETEASKQLQSDFADALRENLTGQTFRHQFEFVELPQSIAAQISDYDRAAKLALSSNIHFLLYGRTRLRSLPQGSSHVIDLRGGTVRIAAADSVIRQRFTEAISDVLPGRTFVPADQSFLSCEIAAQHVGAAAKYIIGTAAAVSGDLEYAEQLLLDAERQLTSQAGQAGSLSAVLLGRVQAMLLDLYKAWLDSFVEAYVLKRDVEYLRKVEPFIAKLRRFDSSNYAAHCVSAMCSFALRRDVATAKAELEQCQQESDATWRYSYAFLEAYDGDLDGAYRTYSKAFSSPMRTPTIPTQSEEFIQNTLDAEPERYWLYYCLGLINYRAKDDRAAAKQDFEHFIKAADPARFPKAVESARKWLREIDPLPPTPSPQGACH